MKPLHKNTIIITVSIIIIIAVLTLGFWLIVNYETEGMPEEGPYVLEVIDGDTFKMSDSSTIRLLCVDTPEKGEEGCDRATKFLESLVLYRNVKLIEGQTLDKIDKYQRDLRFVYVNTSKGEIFVNEEIVRLGFGELYGYGDDESECESKIRL